MNTFKSDLSGKEYPLAEKMEAKTIRKSLLKLIRKDFPAFESSHCLSSSELNVYREKYIAEYLAKELEELNELESRVMESITSNTTITDKLENEDSQDLTLGQRLADKVATFGGSWYFIGAFLFFMAVWIVLNLTWFLGKAFDPYPFILLNLILSCIAALQAPVIMMSQNRQEEKDRDRAKKDYMINLKSELEIRTLHEKLDHLIMHQQQELMEIQKIQIEMMNDIMSKVSNSNAKNKHA
ncbi:MAG TPA: DUF1003 domain-containing protein [Bacteroidia bacterium]|nr:DUF1003 domain-containing protein [Bacteroidia bacterium]